MKQIKYLTIFLLFLLIGFIARAAFGQDTMHVSRDASIIDRGNNKRLIQIQRGQNYQNDVGVWQRWTVDIDSEATYVKGAIKYNLKHQRGRNLFRAGLDSAVWKFEYDGIYVVQRLLNPKKESATWKRDQVIWKNALKGTDIYLTPTPDGVKEDIILRSAASPDTLKFEMEVSAVPKQTATGVSVGPLTLPNPTATDADGANVSVAWTWTGPVAGTYLVHLIPNKTGAAYPITIDPTISITDAEQAYQLAQVTEATYAAARDAATADQIGVNGWVGQILSGGQYYVGRMAYWWPVVNYSTDTMLVDSIRIKLDGNGDASTTDFNVLFYPSFASRSGLAGDYIKFIGRTSAAPHVGKTLTKVWNTASYAAGLNNIFVFTEAGEDSVEAHFGDTLKVMAVSSRDSSNTAPTGNEYANLNENDTQAVLEIYYQTPFRITALSAAADSGLRAIYDTTIAGLPGGKVPDTLMLAYSADSTVISAGQYHIPALHGGAFIDTVFGLRGDSSFTVIAMGFSGGDTVYQATSALTARTRAKAPTIDTLAGYSPGSLYLSMGQSLNQATTRIAVKDCTYNRFMTTGGDTAGGTLWATKSQWKGIVIDVPRRLPSTKFKFVAIAKNGDSLLSSFGGMDSAWTNATVKAVTLARIDTGKFRFTTQAETLDATFNPSYFLAIDKDGDGGKDTVLTDTTTATITGNLAAAFIDTTRTTNAVLHPNQRIKFRLQRRDNADSTVYSALDTFFTNPKAPTIDTSVYGKAMRMFSDTSFQIKVNTSGNRTSLLFAIEDSYSAAKDSPRTWVYPSQFKLTADTGWTDTTVIGNTDTVVMLRRNRPWPQGATTIPWVYYKAGDSVYNELKAHP